MTVVMVPFDGRFLDRSVHALDLPVGPGMFDFGQSMIDPVFAAAHVEHMRHVFGGRPMRSVAGR